MNLFFKCNVLGGFRLSDVNRNVKQNDYFYIDDQICATSRAIRAALDKKWMVEVSEQEASQHITVPRQASILGVQDTEDGAKRVITTNQLATPNMQGTNSKLESRQAERGRQPAQRQKVEDKVVIPNFVATEKTMKIRQADVMTKGPDEVLKSPVESRKEQKIEIVKEKSVTKEDINKFLSDQDTIKNLDKEIDNSLLSVPNFDEKVEKKEEIKQEIEKKVRRRRMVETPETEIVQ